MYCTPGIYWTLNTGHFGGGQSVVGDDVSAVLYQPRARVHRSALDALPAVLRGIRHRLRRSHRLRRALCHRLVDHPHRNQQIRRRLPPVSGN